MAVAGMEVWLEIIAALQLTDAQVSESIQLSWEDLFNIKYA